VGSPGEAIGTSQRMCSPSGRTWKGGSLVVPPSGASSRRSPRSSNTSVMHAVTHNPVKGVKRPKVESYEGKTPALGDG
jgi:hypothetical protein